MRLVVAACLLLLAGSSARAASWDRVGPFLSGSVTALVADPSSDGVVYAASESGIFRSTDRGAHWVRSSRGLPICSILTLTIDRHAPATLYTICADGRIFRSLDGASSWEAAAALGGTEYGVWASLVVDASGVVYASLQGYGVSRSDDQGRTWRSVQAGLDSPFLTALAVSTSPPGVLYAATDSSVFTTYDSGGSWVKTSNESIAALFVDPRSSTNVYAITIAGIVTRSRDGARSWVPVGRGLPPGAAPLRLEFDTSASSTLYLATNRSVYRSSDAGETWVDLGMGIEARDLCPWGVVAAGTPTTLYLGNQCSGGIFRSADQGETWTRTRETIEAPAANALIPDAGSDAILTATARGLYRVRAGDANASSLGLDEREIVAVAQAVTDPSTLYASEGSGTLWRTTDGGASWSPTGFAPVSRADVVAVSSLSAAVVFAADDATLLRSPDSGGTWQIVRSFGSTISVFRESGASLWLGTSRGELWASDDGGDAWRLVHAFESDQQITAVVVDSQNSSRLVLGWISYDVGPYGTPYGGILRSVDDGADWDSLVEGVGVASVIESPTDGSVLYLARIRAQVERSDDGGAHWESLSDGLPDSVLTGLAVNPSAPVTLYAAATGLEATGVLVRDVSVREPDRISRGAGQPRTVTRPH